MPKEKNSCTPASVGVFFCRFPGVDRKIGEGFLYFCLFVDNAKLQNRIFRMRPLKSSSECSRGIAIQKIIK